MKCFTLLFACLPDVVHAWAPVPCLKIPSSPRSRLHNSADGAALGRRCFFGTMTCASALAIIRAQQASAITAPPSLIAISPWMSDYVKGDLEDEYIAAQQGNSDKLDLNSAAIDQYKRLSGFFPHAAGQIASHGPYSTVQEIYDIKGLTSDDKKLFNKYQDEFIVLPPGRMFGERLNSRQSQ